MSAVLDARFRHRIKVARAQDRVPGKCWLFQGRPCKRGYARVYRRKSDPTTLVHRLVYEALVGPIPTGLQIDHLCRIRHCCNPRHLEPVTNLENSLRSERATRTHCKRGHPLSGDNLILKGPNERGRRRCRTCYYERQADDAVRASA